MEPQIIIDKLIKAAEKNEGCIIELSADQVKELVGTMLADLLKRSILGN